MFHVDNDYKVPGPGKNYPDGLHYIQGQEECAYEPLMDEEKRGFAIRGFVIRTDNSTDFSSSGRNPSKSEILSNTESADTTTVYWPRSPPANVDEVVEEESFPVKNDKIIKPIGTEIDHKETQYTGQENL